MMPSPFQTKEAAAARWITLPGGRHVHLDAPSPVRVHDAPSVVRVAGERGRSRVMQFAKPGFAEELDKRVKFVTNTDAGGHFADGALRIEIADATNREVYERPMAQLPALVRQLASKNYDLHTQYYRSRANVVKAEGNPNHDELGRFASGPGGGGVLSVDRRDDAEQRVDNLMRERANAQLAKRGFEDGDLLRFDEPTGSTFARARAMNNGKAGIEILDDNGKVLGYDTSPPWHYAKKIADDEPHPLKQNTQKAASDKWITLPGGKHIPIGGSGGGSGSGTGASSESSPAQARTARSGASESSGSAGEGLTQAQRQTIAAKLSARLGIDPETVKVAEQDESDENGKKAGEYDPDTGTITLYPESFARGKDELMGTLAHEAAHQKLDKVLKEYAHQREAYQGGESLTGGKVEIFKTIQPAFAQGARAAYALADGQSAYDTLFWNRYQQEPTTSRYVNAMSETLAESARLTLAGQGGSVHPMFRNLMNQVNTFAAKL